MCVVMRISVVVGLVEVKFWHLNSIRLTEEEFEDLKLRLEIEKITELALKDEL